MKMHLIIKETPFMPEASQQAKERFRFVPVADLKYQAPEYMIDELFETETLGLIFGEPGCGKSFLAVDIGLSVASGTPFHGRKVKQGSVFFIAGEGHNGLARRFAAWSKARDVPLSDIPLFKSERAAQFLDGASANAVADAVVEMSNTHGSPALIIVDTLARNFGAGDENNTKDMSEFIVAIDGIKANFANCSVLIVHHTGHGEKYRARGAMALKGALDTEYRIEKKGIHMKMVNTKMKDAEPPNDLHFSFAKIDLDGIAESAVLQATEATQRKALLTPTQKLAHDTYATAAAQYGIWDDDLFYGVHVEHWRPVFYANSTGDTVEAKKKAFQRFRKSMTASELMSEQDGVCLICDMDIQMEIKLLRDKRDLVGQNEECPDAEADNSGTSGTNA